MDSIYDVETEPAGDRRPETGKPETYIPLVANTSLRAVSSDEGGVRGMIIPYSRIVSSKVVPQSNTEEARSVTKDKLIESKAFLFSPSSRGFGTEGIKGGSGMEQLGDLIQPHNALTLNQESDTFRYGY